MHFKINLASQPFEDAGQFYRRWGLIVSLLLLLAAGLSYTTFVSWNRYRFVNADINRERATLAQLDKQTTDDVAILNQPQNSDVRRRSAFLNELIERKAISWTHIFSDLEKIMPAELHVVTIQPKTEGGDILLQMTVVGRSRERALELVRRMEQSNSFRDAQILTEVQGTNSNGGPDNLKFDITAQYIPETTEAGAALANNGDGGGR